MLRSSSKCRNADPLGRSSGTRELPASVRGVPEGLAKTRRPARDRVAAEDDRGDPRRRPDAGDDQGPAPPVNPSSPPEVDRSTGRFTLPSTGFARGPGVEHERIACRMTGRTACATMAPESSHPKMRRHDPRLSTP